MSEPDHIFRPMSRKAIEADGVKLLRHYQPEVLQGKCSFDVEYFAEYDLEELTGVEFDITSELPPEIHGLTDPIQNKLWVHADLADDPRCFKFYRSTLAHEIGHCLYHVKQIQSLGRKQIFAQGKKKNGAELYRKKDVPPYCQPEWQAWEAAGSLLMPQCVVQKMLYSGANIVDLAEHFEVNVAFARTRLRALKIDL